MNDQTPQLETLLKEELAYQAYNQEPSFDEVALTSSPWKPEHLIKPSLQTSLSFCVLFGCFLLILLNLKRWKQSKPPAYQNQLKILEKQIIGPKTFLVRVENQGKSLLLGFHEAQFQIISQEPSSAPEQQSLLEQQTQSKRPSLLSPVPPDPNTASESKQASVDQLSTLIREKLKHIRPS